MAHWIIFLFSSLLKNGACGLERIQSWLTYPRTWSSTSSILKFMIREFIRLAIVDSQALQWTTHVKSFVRTASFYPRTWYNISSLICSMNEPFKDETFWKVSLSCHYQTRVTRKRLKTLHYYWVVWRLLSKLRLGDFAVSRQSAWQLFQHSRRLTSLRVWQTIMRFCSQFSHCSFMPREFHNFLQI